MKFRLCAKILLIYLGLTFNLNEIKSNFIPGSKINSDKKGNELERLSSTGSDDCSTPIDCYTKAIDALNLAKQTYYNAVDKLESIQDTLIKYIDEKVNNSTSELKSYTEGIRNDLISKINSVQDSSNTRFNDINSSVHNHVCREVDTGCKDDGGGNFVYADRHWVGCNDNEFMKTWRWIRCDGNRTIRVHYTCCRHP